MKKQIRKERLNHPLGFVSSIFPEALLARSHMKLLSQSSHVVLVFKE